MSMTPASPAKHRGAGAEHGVAALPSMVSASAGSHSLARAGSSSTML